MAGYKRELAKIDRDDEKLVKAVLSGVDSGKLKAEADRINTRRAALTAILDGIEEAPVLFHPNMAERYRREVEGLIAALNRDETREEAAQLLRRLVERVVLTPKADGEGYAIDLVGDLAGILGMAVGGDLALIAAGSTYLDEPSGSEQVALVAGAGFEPAAFRL